METRIIRLPEVIHQTGLSRATIYRMIKSGRFPLAFRLGKRAHWLAQGRNRPLHRYA